MMHVAMKALSIQCPGYASSAARSLFSPRDRWRSTKKAIGPVYARTRTRMPSLNRPPRTCARTYGSSTLLCRLRSVEVIIESLQSLSDRQLDAIRQSTRESSFVATHARCDHVCSALKSWISALLQTAELTASNDACIGLLARLQVIRSAQADVNAAHKYITTHPHACRMHVACMLQHPCMLQVLRAGCMQAMCVLPAGLYPHGPALCRGV